MAVRVSPVDVTGRFDGVTGRRSLSLTLYHKIKSGEMPLQAAPQEIWSYFHACIRHCFPRRQGKNLNSGWPGPVWKMAKQSATGCFSDGCDRFAPSLAVIDKGGRFYCNLGKEIGHRWENIHHHYLNNGIRYHLSGLYFWYISKNNSIEPLHSLDGALEIW